MNARKNRFTFTEKMLALSTIIAVGAVINFGPGARSASDSVFAEGTAVYHVAEQTPESPGQLAPSLVNLAVARAADMGYTVTPEQIAAATSQVQPATSLATVAKAGVQMVTANEITPEILQTAAALSTAVSN